MCIASIVDIFRGFPRDVSRFFLKRPRFPAVPMWAIAFRTDMLKRGGTHDPSRRTDAVDPVRDPDSHLSPLPELSCGALPDTCRAGRSWRCGFSIDLHLAQRGCRREIRNV